MAHAMHAPLVLLALLTGPSAQQSPPAEKDAPVAARRATLRQTLQRDGWLVPAEAALVNLDFEAYAGELEIAEFLPPGTTVNEGDILVRFDPQKLDEQLKQLPGIANCGVFRLDPVQPAVCDFTNHRLAEIFSVPADLRIDRVFAGQEAAKLKFPVGIRTRPL